MIAFIKGTVASYTIDTVVVDHDGMGWEIAYAHTDELSLNKEIQVFTYLHIFEGGMNLYGFESMQEKELFLKLISVKGLGPKTAMNLLAKAGVNNIIRAIESGDVASLKKLPGIGAKSASQIVLDLKGKLVETPTNVDTKQLNKYSQEITDAIEGLKNLGYKQSELSNCIHYMAERPGLTVEEYMSMGLRYMAK